MNAFIKLFKQLIFPHLWATHGVLPAAAWPAIGAVAGAASSYLGGGDQESEVAMPGWMEDSSRQYYDRLSQSSTDPNNTGFWQGYNPQMYEGDLQARMPDWLKGEYKDYMKDDRNLDIKEGYMRDTARGKGLGLNPAMQAAVMNPAMDATASRFAAMGRSGMNPANVQSQNTSGMQALMPFHNAALNRQFQAAQGVTDVDDQRMDRAALRGDAVMRDKQGVIDRNRYQNDFASNKYLNRMQNWQGLLGQMGSGGGGVGTTSMSQPNGSWLSGAMGGGLLGNELYQNYQNLSGPPAGSTNEQNWQTGAAGGLGQDITSSDPYKQFSGYSL